MDLPFLINESPPALHPESGYVYPKTILTDTQYAQEIFMNCKFTNDQEKLSKAKESLKTFKKVAILCAIFMVSEFVGGIISNSVAVYSDALHMLSDMTGYFINIIGLKISMREPSPFFTYGPGRVEIVGAIFSILLIWVLSLFLVMKAIGRIEHPPTVSGPVMVLVASLGIVTNILIAWLFMGSGHGHSHFGIPDDDSPVFNRRASKRAGSGQRNVSSNARNSVNFAGSHEQSDASYGEVEQISDAESEVNISIKSAYLHTLGDLLQNVGVLLAGVTIWINPKKFIIMDPVCTLFFAVNIWVMTIPTAVKCFYVLMDTAPKNFDTVEILTSIRNIKYVQAVEDFHVWSVDMKTLALTVKLDISGNEHGCNCSKRSGVTKRVREIADEKGIDHCNIEITEVYSEEKW